MVNGKPALAVPMAIEMNQQRSGRLVARLAVELDTPKGGPQEDSPPIGGDGPQFLFWEDSTGARVDDVPRIAPGAEESWTAVVSVPGDAAVRVWVDVTD